MADKARTLVIVGGKTVSRASEKEGGYPNHDRCPQLVDQKVVIVGVAWEE